MNWDSSWRNRKQSHKYEALEVGLGFKLEELVVRLGSKIEELVLNWDSN